MYVCALPKLNVICDMKQANLRALFFSANSTMCFREECKRPFLKVQMLSSRVFDTLRRRCHEGADRLRR